MQIDFTRLKKYQKPLLHVLIWAMIFSLPYIFSLQGEDTGMKKSLAHRILFLNSVMNVFWVITFYLNSSLLIPKLLYKRKFGIFLLSNVLLLVIILLINRWLYDLLVTELPYFLHKGIFYNGLPFLFFLLISIAFRTVSDRMALIRTAQERESENLKTELAFLRSQISPHFLLNVLNNIVALVRTSSKDLEPTIMKLSSMMQYMLYETDEGKVLLLNEVEYLQSYIELQSLRFGDRLKINFNKDIKEDWHIIEPMLLVPFVENAFKHGTGLIDDPVIEIILSTTQNQIHFSVQNKFLPSDESKDKESGIGLSNVKRRLQLLYKNKHQLKIEQKDGWFKVKLRIELE